MAYTTIVSLEIEKTHKLPRAMVNAAREPLQGEVDIYYGAGVAAGWGPTATSVRPFGSMTFRIRATGAPFFTGSRTIGTISALSTRSGA